MGHAFGLDHGIDERGIDPARLMKRFQDADAVARAGIRALERGERLRIPGWSNRVMYLGLKVVPRAIVGGAARRVFRELISGTALTPAGEEAKPPAGGSS